jgi:cytochrome c oxidase accessory protein FixG
MIQARAVHGRWRRLRWWADAALIAVLLGIPWIRIAGEPLVWLDIPARKFHVFGLVIVPQELYFLWLLLAGLALALFLFSALLGRLWCGWACPQTVFTDVFAAAARFIQGWRGPRPPARVTLWRRIATHAVWLAASLVIGFHVVGYFVPPRMLLERLAHGPAGPAFGFLGAATLLAYLDFAWVRQTFCKYLCPYARFQGVLLDRDSLVIGYDTQRGEPRGKKGTTTGDCVDCGLCVQVCPTGIDIRKGLQLECIACTQCIDACDGVMAQLGRPRGLIDYRSWVSLQGLGKARLLRPRVAAYGALLVLVSGAFGIALGERVPIGLRVLHNAESLTTRAADGRLGNAFTLRVENRDRVERRLHLRLEQAEFELVAGMNPLVVAPTSAIEARVFVMAPAGWQPEPTELRFVLEREDDPSTRVEDASSFLVRGGHREEHDDDDDEH